MEDDGRMTGDGHCSRFGVVVKLAMAALLADLRPSVALGDADGFPYGHDRQCIRFDW